ncbi:putative ATP-dependent Clp protease ATP-binding subunit clpA -like protein CD4A, chloroplastic-like [Capsicum annuum]|nr:putative ATP-dependent Clp protease ATP-binding subunit clpA -like protein CD4A, chloroplastic-like [Capsicum annuum]
MEDSDKLWSDRIPPDILGSIASRLVVGEYFVFRDVCKQWRLAPLMPPSHRPRRLHDDLQLPYLMTLHEKTGIVEFFDLVYNVVTTHNPGISKLKGSRIRSSKAGWLLMSHGNRGMFFFNPIDNDIIELPDLEQRENICSCWTFSCPPDSEGCFVVGFDTYGTPPDIYIIKVGETTWTYHYSNDTEYGYNERIFELHGCNNAVFIKKNIIYILGDKGNLATLSINEKSTTEVPTWKFYGKLFRCRRRKQNSIQRIYIVEDTDDKGMFAFLTRSLAFLTHSDSRCVTSTEGGSTPYLQNSFNFQGLHPRLLIKLLVANFLMEGARSCKRELAKSSHFLCSWIN